MNKKYKGLDGLFSQFVRMRAMKRVGGCERCLSKKFDITKDNGDILPAWKQLQNSHYKGRRKLSVRFDEDNCAGLCGGCHTHLEHQPDEHRDWKLEQLGEKRFEDLQMRAAMPNKPDINLLTIYFKQQIKEL